MKTVNTSLRWFIPAGLFAMLFVGLVAWTGRPVLQANGNHSDTIPSKKNKTLRDPNAKDLDYELRKLDEAQERLENLQGKDWGQIQSKIEEAMQKVNTDKFRLQKEEALRQVDIEKIQRAVKEAMEKVDFKKVLKDAEKAMEHASRDDREKIAEELQRARKQMQEDLNKANFEKLQQELEQTKKLRNEEVEEAMKRTEKELSKLKDELATNKLNLGETMQKARTGIDKAREALKGYQDMIYEMESAGLLSTKNDYTIEWKDGDLFIDNKKQTAETAARYGKYFERNTRIEKKNGKFTIRNY